MLNTKILMGPALLVIVIFTLGSMLSCVVHTADRDTNPPGPRGGPGTNWENPPGPSGGPGASPNRRRWDRDNNPPGTNWENPPGPRGGPGASPDRWW
jgi:hypothetical protein